MAAELVVVKIGGASLETPRLREQFCRDVAALAQGGARLVVAHGGGKQISTLLGQLGIEPVFRDGQRVTDARTLDVAAMVLCGQVGPALVRGIAVAGGRAIGLHGGDGALCRGRVTTGALGLVADELSFDVAVVRHLMPAYIPVVSSIALAADGAPLNVNADVFAAELAIALGATRLLLLTDTPGVLGDAGEVIARLDASQATALIARGVITGGMIPKVEFALAAMRRGVGHVAILDGRAPGVLAAALAGGAVGTFFSSTPKAS